MKRTLSFLCALLCLLTLAACGKDNPQKGPDALDPPPEEEAPVVFYLPDATRYARAAIQTAAAQTLASHISTGGVQFILHSAYQDATLSAKYGADFTAVDVTEESVKAETNSDGSLLGQITDLLPLPNKLVQSGKYRCAFVGEKNTPETADVWIYAVSYYALEGWKIDSSAFSQADTDTWRENHAVQPTRGTNKPTEETTPVPPQAFSRETIQNKALRADLKNVETGAGDFVLDFLYNNEALQKIYGKDFVIMNGGGTDTASTATAIKQLGSVLRQGVRRYYIVGEKNAPDSGDVWVCNVTFRGEGENKLNAWQVDNFHLSVEETEEWRSKELWQNYAEIVDTITTINN
ncbi:MAG: hypothetical protein LBN05_08800 [Oscillospiraceae bacterium]|jgi:predicted small lipoprotein YifL|nr:hypothetical protein [Oscillospiraceae bacterium]